jgi:hypothetical protein
VSAIVKHRRERHQCNLPQLDFMSAGRVGDLWRCDDCGRLWECVHACSMSRHYDCRWPGGRHMHLIGVDYRVAGLLLRIRHRHDGWPPTTITIEETQST